MNECQYIVAYKIATPILQRMYIAAHYGNVTHKVNYSRCYCNTNTTHLCKQIDIRVPNCDSVLV